MILTRSRRQRLRRIARRGGADGLFLLEGPRAVHDALESGAVVEVWIEHHTFETRVQSVRERALALGLAVGEAPASDLARLSHTVTPQGVVAVVTDVAQPAGAVLSRPGWTLLLDGVQDPGNVGAIVRTTAGFGGGGLLLTETSAHPLGPKAMRASAGLALRVPYARAARSELLAAVSRSGRELWLLEAGGSDLARMEAAPSPSVLAVGSEGSGPSAPVRQAARGRLGISLSPGVESLNVAVAAGIALAFLTRGRQV